MIKKISNFHFYTDRSDKRGISELKTLIDIFYTSQLNKTNLDNYYYIGYKTQELNFNIVDIYIEKKDYKLYKHIQKKYPMFFDRDKGLK